MGQDPIINATAAATAASEMLRTHVAQVAVAAPDVHCTARNILQELRKAGVNLPDCETDSAQPGQVAAAAASTDIEPDTEEPLFSFAKFYGMTISSVTASSATAATAPIHTSANSSKVRKAAGTGSCGTKTAGETGHAPVPATPAVGLAGGPIAGRVTGRAPVHAGPALGLAGGPIAGGVSGLAPDGSGREDEHEREPVAQHDGRIQRFRSTIEKCIDENEPIVADVKNATVTNFGGCDRSQKEQFKKAVNEQKALLMASRKKLADIESRAKAVQAATRDACKDILAKADDLCEVCKLLIELLSAWIKEPIVCTEWLEKIKALEDRGHPLDRDNGEVCAVTKTTFEQRLRFFMLYNKVTRESTHWSNACPAPPSSNHMALPRVQLVL